MTQNDPYESSGEQPTDNSREICYEHSQNLVSFLTSLGSTLLISTYQAGKLVTLGVDRKTLALALYNFDRPMGIAVRQDSLVVAGRQQIWFLQNVPEVAPRVDPQGKFDACYLTRRAQFTGEIQAHEMAFVGDELWVVNTLFSCLCTLDDRHNFVPRWQPSFISSLAAEDRCHLNGMAVCQGKVKYVTVMGRTDSPGAWRVDKNHGGCLIDVENGQTVAQGFAMPHSPRIYRDALWLLDSGKGLLVRVDRETGSVEQIAQLPGFTRGLAFYDRFAFVGLSKIRETSTFGGVPIAEDPASLKCGVGVVDITSGLTVATFEFKSGVDEIFDVAILAGVSSPTIRGPYAQEENLPTIWTVPQPTDN